MASLTFKQRALLTLQKSVSYLCFPLVCLYTWVNLVFIAKVRIANLKEVRKQFKAIRQSHQGPFLLCPNHLTFVDSIIVAWGLMSFWQFVFFIKSFPWNLPKEKNVAISFFYRLMCYVGRCVMIPEDATKAKKALAKSIYLLNQGYSFIVFPEGTRSNNGRINTTKYVYGVGQLIREVDNLKVISIYLRGRHQQKATLMPKHGEVFDMFIEEIQPKTEQKGLRGMRDLATQLIQQLVKMEEKYFKERKTH